MDTHQRLASALQRMAQMLVLAVLALPGALSLETALLPDGGGVSAPAPPLEPVREGPVPIPPAPYDASVLPGPFPVSLTGMKINVDAAGIKKWAWWQAGRFSISVCGAGPSRWSVAAFAAGTVSPRISPGRILEVAALGKITAGPRGFHPTNASHVSVQAWNPTASAGVLIPSVARLGDNKSWRFAAIAGISRDRTRGFGYSMNNGSFLLGELDVCMNRAGIGGDSRALMDHAVAWFPYRAGWVGGWIGGDQLIGARWIRFFDRSRKLPDDAGLVFEWTGNSTGFLHLPAVDPVNSGLLFCTSVRTRPTLQTSTVTVTPEPEKSGWSIQSRESSDLAPVPSPQPFAFVFVPFGSSGMLGGFVDGASGALNSSSGNVTVTKDAVGNYTIRLPFPVSSCGSGMLLLQAVKSVSQEGGAPTFLTYQPRPDGALSVSCNSLMLIGHAAVHREILVDSDFYFAWVDFSNPMAPTPPPSAQPTTNMANAGGPSAGKERHDGYSQLIILATIIGILLCLGATALTIVCYRTRFCTRSFVQQDPRSAQFGVAPSFRTSLAGEEKELLYDPQLMSPSLDLEYFARSAQRTHSLRFGQSKPLPELPIQDDVNDGRWDPSSSSSDEDEEDDKTCRQTKHGHQEHPAGGGTWPVTKEAVAEPFAKPPRLAPNAAEPYRVGLDRGLDRHSSASDKHPLPDRVGGGLMLPAMRPDGRTVMLPAVALRPAGATEELRGKAPAVPMPARGGTAREGHVARPQLGTGLAEAVTEAWNARRKGIAGGQVHGRVQAEGSVEPRENGHPSAERGRGGSQSEARAGELAQAGPQRVPESPGHTGWRKF